MHRRPWTVVLLAAAALVASAPTAAHASTPGQNCRRLFLTNATVHSTSETPDALISVLRQYDNGTWWARYLHDLDADTATTITRCAYVDRNGNGRYDPDAPEALYALRTRYPADTPAGTTTTRFAFPGAQHGDRLCVGTQRWDRPTDGPTGMIGYSPMCFVLAAYSHGAYDPPLPG